MTAPQETASTAVAVVPSPADRRLAWLAARKTCITATDVGKLFGVGRGGPMAVWLDKTGKMDKEQADNPAMRFGRRFERPILEEYADIMRVPLQFADSYDLIKAPSAPLLGATLDARRMDDWRPVDAKNVGFRSSEYGEAGSDVIPLSYALQLHTQMVVTGAELADLAVLFNRYEFVPYTVRFDHLVAERIIEVASTFWYQHVLTDIPPEVDGSTEYSSWISRQFARQASKTFVRATPDHHAVAVALDASLENLAGMEEVVDALKNKLKLAIGEAGGIEGPSWKATWTQAKDSTSIDHKEWCVELCRRLAEATGRTTQDVVDEMLPQFSTTKAGSRRFTFTYKGDK